MSLENSEIQIRRPQEDELSQIISLISKSFHAYVAGDYSAEGVATFSKFVTPEAFEERSVNNSIWVATGGEENELLGVIEIKEHRHISIYFVAVGLIGKGIGKKLMEAGLQEIKENNPDLKAVTVNASPFALGIYQKMGFIPTSEEKEDNGLRFIPMEKSLPSLE